jgi:RNA polymerase sigma factor (sigma-70 family)
MYRAVLKTQPDRKLAALAAAGSEPAFEAIVERYRRALLGYCQGRLRLSENRAEDIVQQSFMNAWGSLRGGTEVRELRPWLYRITHNQAISAMRASSCDEISINDLRAGLGPAGGQQSSHTSPVDDVYEHQQLLRETLTAVASLPELQRQALVATAVEGLSYEQVADALNTSSDAVRGLVYRARNTLRTRAAVFFPTPLVLWAASQGAQLGADSLQQGISEAGLGGGSLGIGAAAAKGIALLASSAAVLSSGIGTGLVSHRHTTTSVSIAAAGTSTRPAATHASSVGHPMPRGAAGAAHANAGTSLPPRSGISTTPPSGVAPTREATRQPGELPSGARPSGARPAGTKPTVPRGGSGSSRGIPPNSTPISARLTASAPPPRMES